jgi:hypothetical protein
MVTKVVRSVLSRMPTSAGASVVNPRRSMSFRVDAPSSLRVRRSQCLILSSSSGSNPHTSVNLLLKDKHGMTCLMSGPPASWLKKSSLPPLEARAARYGNVPWVFGLCVLADHRQMSAVLSASSLTYWCHLSAWVDSCVVFTLRLTALWRYNRGAWTLFRSNAYHGVGSRCQILK